MISPIFLFTYEKAELKQLAPGPPAGETETEPELNLQSL